MNKQQARLDYIAQWTPLADTYTKSADPDMRKLGEELLATINKVRSKHVEVAANDAREILARARDHKSNVAAA